MLLAILLLLYEPSAPFIETCHSSSLDLVLLVLSSVIPVTTNVALPGVKHLAQDIITNTSVIRAKPKSKPKTKPKANQNSGRATFLPPPPAKLHKDYNGLRDGVLVIQMPN